MEPENPAKNFQPAADQNQNDPPTSSNRILNNQQQEIPTANFGGAYTDTKIFKWEIDNVMGLPQKNGEYVQSEIFTSKGPYGQPDVKWAMLLFPRGKYKRNTKNNLPSPVPVSLQLMDGNGSNYVKVDWKLAILNENGDKVIEGEKKSCLYDLKSVTHDATRCFENYMSRKALDEKYIVEGHKLILLSEISVKVEKDLQADLLEKTELTKDLKRKLESKEEETKNLKRKLESKEEQNGKLGEDFEQRQKDAEAFANLQRTHAIRFKAENEKLKAEHLTAIEKIKGDHLTAIEKLKKAEEERCAKLRLEHGKQMKYQEEDFSKHNLATIEKCQKAEEAHSKLRTEFDRSQKNHRAEIVQLEKNNLLVLEKCRIQGEERSNQLHLENEQRLNVLREQIVDLRKEKELLEKCQKDEIERLNQEKSAALEKYNEEKERSNQLNSLVNRLKEENENQAKNLTKISKLVEKIKKGNDKSAAAGCSAKMALPK